MTIVMTREDLLQRGFEKELRFTATRSSGPGGQNVNKVSTRIELRFNVRKSKILSDIEKGVILDKLRNRINSEGELILSRQSERSLVRNREKAVERFYDLLAVSLAPVRPRIPTKRTASSTRTRLESKRKRSDIKRLRNRSDDNSG